MTTQHERKLFDITDITAQDGIALAIAEIAAISQLLLLIGPDNAELMVTGMPTKEMDDDSGPTPLFMIGWMIQDRILKIYRFLHENDLHYRMKPEKADVKGQAKIKSPEGKEGEATHG